MARARRVAVWRREILPISETFVANQMAAMRRWHPVLLGEKRATHGLDVHPEFLLCSSDSGRWDSLTQRRFRALRRDAALDKFIRHSDLDLIHAHFGESATDILPTALRHRIPLVVTFHGVDITRRLLRSSARDQLYRSRLKGLFRDAAQILAVSEFIAERLVVAGAPPNSVVVKYIGTKTNVPVMRDDAAGILFVGRLVEKKGPEDLIRAVAALPPDLRRTPVTIVGAGPLEQRLRSAAHDLNLNIAFTGAQDPACVAELMSRHAIFCVPSRRASNGDSEGLGMVFLEACAAGLPVVSTDHGGIPEVVTHSVNGLLAHAGDPVSIAAALRRLLTDANLRRRLGRRGMAEVEERFNIHRCTEELEDLYDRICAAQNGLRVR